MPGHPAIKIGSAHKKKFEAWLADVLATARVEEPQGLARQIVLLMDGAFSIMLVHRDASYVEAAGKAAAALVHLSEIRDAERYSLANKSQLSR